MCRLTIAPSEQLRLLGIREGNEFHIVWWDANHDVWPEDKQVPLATTARYDPPTPCPQSAHNLPTVTHKSIELP